MGNLYSPINIRKDLFEHSGFIKNNYCAFGISVGAWVNDAVHIQVEVVHLNVCRESVLETPVDVRVLIRQPPKHLGDPMQLRWGFMIHRKQRACHIR